MVTLLFCFLNGEVSLISSVISEGASGSRTLRITAGMGVS